MTLAADQRRNHDAAMRRAAQTERRTTRIVVDWGIDLRRSVARGDTIGQVAGRLRELPGRLVPALRDSLRDQLDISYTAASAAMGKELRRRGNRVIRALVEAEQPAAGRLHNDDPTGVSIVDDLARLRGRTDVTLAELEGVLFPPLGRDRVEALLRQSIWSSRETFVDRLRRLADDRQMQSIASILVDSLGAGDSQQTLTRRLGDVVEGQLFRSRRIARTESLRVAELANRESWRGLQDHIDQVEVLATLDAHTRPAHRERHGRRYIRRGEGYVADNGDPLPHLPDEPNCRCYASPVIDL